MEIEESTAGDRPEERAEPAPEAIDAVPAPRPRRPRRWFALLYAAPLLLLFAGIALPLARGLETLYLRDVLNTHLEMKWAQAEALRAGYFPVITPYRAGGQPLSGNPNSVPFYPTNLLYLIGSPFWALNAHFWIHLLLAPFAFYWMARSWGLGREPAWAAAACYALCGFYLSHLSFYNLIAGATLAPALVAAALDFHRPERRRRWTAPALALLWALLLLGGDPLMAALALALAGGVVLPYWIRKGERPGWGRFFQFAASFLAGTLLALPQLTEFLRILPISFRGHWGYTEQVATVASWDPRQLAEWFVPFVFGRLDLIAHGAFWGSKYFTDVPPYYPTLYPGLLALALVAAAGLPRGRTSRAAWWAWAGIAAGLFFSLGRFNPAVAWLFGLEGGSSLRYPVKFWMPVAVGGALLCGLGFERLIARLEEGARRRFRWALALLALGIGGFWLYLSFSPAAAEGWMRGFIPRSELFVTNERIRWAGLCLFSLVVIGSLATALRLSRTRPYAGGALLLAVHAVAQVFFLQPAYPTDAVLPYWVRPPLLDHVPADAAVVNPEFNSIFGPSQLKKGRFPVPDGRWLERRAFTELYPFTAPIWGRRYELNTSPEGLDTFLTRMAQGSVKRATDPERIRLLAAWGVDRIVLNRRLDGLPGVRLVARQPSFGKEVNVYEVTGAAPEALLARRVLRAPHLNAGYDILKGTGFDPRADVLIPGEGPPAPKGGGTARVVRRGPEELEVEVEVGPGGSVLLVQRSHHLWKATVDGRPAEVTTANFHRLGVEVPEGRHRVRLWIDRAPFHRSLLGTAAGLLLLPVLLVWGRRSSAAKIGALS